MWLWKIQRIGRSGELIRVTKKKTGREGKSRGQTLGGQNFGFLCVEWEYVIVYGLRYKEGIPVRKGNLVITLGKMNLSNEWHQEEKRTQRKVWNRKLRDGDIYRRKEVKITSAGRCRWLQRQWNPTGKEAQEAVVLMKYGRSRRIRKTFLCRWRKILVKIVLIQCEEVKMDQRWSWKEWKLWN